MRKLGATLRPHFARSLAGCVTLALVALITTARADMLVTSREGSQSILRYDETTGAFLGTFVAGGSDGLTVPNDMAIGPDGNLYVSEFAPNGAVRRYNGTTGEFIGVFAVGDGSSLSGPRFGPDGNLYVGRFEAGEIARYDGTTGAFIDVFVPGPSFLNGFTFGPDGNLYVGSGDVINRYNGSTGAFADVFASTPNFPADANLNRPLFGLDGNLYARNIAANSIERYNGQTGAFMDTFASGNGLLEPLGFTFGPDGNLYVASTGNDRVLRYNGVTGAFIDTFVAAGSGGLDFPSSIIFTPVPEPSTLLLAAIGLVFFAWLSAKLKPNKIASDQSPALNV